MPELSGIGFGGKADLYREMRRSATDKEKSSHGGHGVHGVIDREDEDDFGNKKADVDGNHPAPFSSNLRNLRF